MSNAGPVKEPSMDEILASIRRIIESGDDRSGLAAVTLQSRDRHAPAVLAAPVRALPVADTERKNIARLVTEAAARQQRLIGDPEPAATGDSQAEEAETSRSIGEGGPQALFPAGGTAPLGAAAGVVHPALPHGTALSDTAVMLPAFWSKPGRGQPPEGSRIEPGEPVDQTSEDGVGDGDAEPEDIDDGFAAVRPHENVIALSSRDTPAAGLRSDAAALPGDLATDDAPDFSLDFDEEDFAEELRNEARLAEMEAAEIAMKVHVTPEPQPPATAEPEPASAAPTASALISEQAGEQVAAAFDDLARAIREGQMKSMEEMAREMLRPMLQEWLDDNLPHLVERLVRDEIERVARGGRR